MTIITRKEAKEKGLIRYFTGIPCPHGHVTERLTKSCNCCGCWDTDKRRSDVRRNSKKHYAKFGNTPEMKAKRKKWKREWYLKNREKEILTATNRIIAKKNRTPPWADLDEIKEIYKNRPEGFVVDHIIPLQGKLVSGLHVSNNLQYLTQFDNLSKLNKFIPYIEKSDQIVLLEEYEPRQS